jgi:hypothetical protein
MTNSRLRSKRIKDRRSEENITREKKKKLRRGEKSEGRRRQNHVNNIILQNLQNTLENSVFFSLSLLSYLSCVCLASAPCLL